jgi:hypothetical protein
MPPVSADVRQRRALEDAARYTLHTQFAFESDVSMCSVTRSHSVRRQTRLIPTLAFGARKQGGPGKSGLVLNANVRTVVGVRMCDV